MNTWTDRSDYDESRAGHELDLTDPIDWLQTEALEARYETRRDFTAARFAVSRWEPAPMPLLEQNASGCDPSRAVYVDELDRPRPWLRS